MILLFARALAPLNWAELLLISPVVYFLTESLGSLGELLFQKTSKTFPIHNHPLKSSSLGDFWGSRWNLWVQDWLRDLSNGHQRKIKLKLFSSFLYSGLFHELMANLPWWVKYRESYFGNMLLYFSIQGLGLWVEKKWIKRWQKWPRRIYFWCVVLIPAPLFINRPMRVFLGIE